MSNTWKVWLASALMSTSFTSFAQAQAKPAAPAPAPAAAATPAPAAPAAEQSFVCKDGSTVSSATSKGACTGHKGIDKDATAKAASAAAKPVAPAAAPAATGKAASTPMAVAPGGGPDKVWANENTKVYHCPGSRHYGTTKHGVYMTEADAKGKGMHASHNKACT